MTIFITTHYLDEADALCDRIAIIDQGAIVAEGTPDELKREVSGDVVSLIARRVDSDKRSSCSAPSRTFASWRFTSPAGCGCGSAAGTAAIPQILRLLEGSGIEPDQIDMRRPSLDDVFLAKTGHKLRED